MLNFIEYTKELNILYVEDDKVLLEETKELLSSFFKDVKVAQNGQEALEIYNKNIDIVITDIKMPKMDGITLSKKIKELNHEQEIIVVSAYDDSDKLINLIKIGVSDFILKPMEFEQLVRVLEKVSKNVIHKKNQEKFLIQQSKLATMGEMIDMIAHQWMQFANVLSMKTEIFDLENSSRNLTKEEIKEYIDYYTKQTQELVDVLNEFRGFFKEKEKQTINLRELIESVLVLLKDFLIKNKIEVELSLKDKEVEVYPNQIKQVIINIIQNMVDAFIERDIKDRKIKIYLDNELYIEDNAGGIENLEQIFNPRFTTKEKGTGMGLYLAQIIMDKNGGEIVAQNIVNGARFILKV